MSYTLSMKDATKESGLSRWTLYKLIRKGKIRTGKVGKKRLIYGESLKAYLDKIEQKI